MATSSMTCSAIPITPFKQSLNELYFENALRHKAVTEPTPLIVLITAQLRSNNEQAKKQLTAAIVRILPEVDGHLKNLELTSFEKKPLVEIERLAIAVYAVVILKKAPTTEIQVISKATSALTRRLFFHGAKRIFSVLPEEDCARIVRQGGTKTAFSAVLLSLNDSSQRYLSCCLTISIQSDLIKQMALREVAYFTALGQQRGLVHLIMSSIYQNRVFSIFEAYTDSLKNSSSEPFTGLQRLKIGLDLLYGLQFLHKAGIAHGDIKSGNAVWSTSFDDQNYAEGALIDLDQAFNPKKGESPNNAYRSGYHPSIINTAPELFGIENAKHFTPEDYFRMDIFAMGVCLERFFLNTNTNNSLPWKNLVYKSFCENFNQHKKTHTDKVRLKKDQELMHTLVTQYVEEQMLICDEEEPKSLLTCMRAVAYNMMCLNPNRRITLSQAIAKFNAIKERA